MNERTLEAVVMEALSRVKDPELGRDLVTLGMIGALTVSPSKVEVEVILTTPACPLKDHIGNDVRAAVGEVVPGAEVLVTFGAKVRDARHAVGDPLDEEAPPLLPHVKNVVLVASGKGGVGKSTVAVNLAVALAAEGASVGLMDADILGPSVPIMLGMPEFPVTPNEDGKTFDPARAHGVSFLSMGFFVPDGEAVIWRGGMQAGAIMQFARDCQWGELDYLLIDLPPGTGDVQLTIAQQLKVTGAVVVSTPQDVALADVVRARAMFAKVNIPILGVIENMSYFICDECSKRHELFGSGGARDKAAEQGLHFFGSLPLVGAVRESGDRGVPQVLDDPESEVARIFVAMARQLAGRVSMEAHDHPGRGGGEPRT